MSAASASTASSSSSSDASFIFDVLSKDSGPLILFPLSAGTEFRTAALARHSFDTGTSAVFRGHFHEYGGSALNLTNLTAHQKTFFSDDELVRLRTDLATFMETKSEDVIPSLNQILRKVPASAFQQAGAVSFSQAREGGLTPDKFVYTSVLCLRLGNQSPPVLVGTWIKGKTGRSANVSTATRDAIEQKLKASFSFEAGIKRIGKPLEKCAATWDGSKFHFAPPVSSASSSAAAVPMDTSGTTPASAATTVAHIAPVLSTVDTKHQITPNGIAGGSSASASMLDDDSASASSAEPKKCEECEESSALLCVGCKKVYLCGRDKCAMLHKHVGCGAKSPASVAPLGSKKPKISMVQVPAATSAAIATAAAVDPAKPQAPASQKPTVSTNTGMAGAKRQRAATTTSASASSGKKPGATPDTPSVKTAGGKPSITTSKVTAVKPPSAAAAAAAAAANPGTNSSGTGSGAGSPSPSKRAKIVQAPASKVASATATAKTAVLAKAPTSTPSTASASTSAAAKSPPEAIRAKASMANGDDSTIDLCSQPESAMTTAGVSNGTQTAASFDQERFVSLGREHEKRLGEVKTELASLNSRLDFARIQNEYLTRDLGDCRRNLNDESVKLATTQKLVEQQTAEINTLKAELASSKRQLSEAQMTAAASDNRVKQQQSEIHTLTRELSATQRVRDYMKYIESLSVKAARVHRAQHEFLRLEDELKTALRAEPTLAGFVDLAFPSSNSAKRLDESSNAAATAAAAVADSTEAPVDGEPKGEAPANEAVAETLDEETQRQNDAPTEMTTDVPLAQPAVDDSNEIVFTQDAPTSVKPSSSSSFVAAPAQNAASGAAAADDDDDNAGRLVPPGVARS